MNATILGADPQELRDLAKDFSHAARQLTQLSTALTQRVNRQGGWTGPDSERFRNDWNVSLRPKIAAANKCFDSTAEALLRNAQEQDQASSSADVGGSPGLPFSPGTPGFPSLPDFPGGTHPPGLPSGPLTNSILGSGESLATWYTALVGGTNALNLAGTLRLSGSFASLEKAMNFSRLAGAFGSLDDFAAGGNWGALAQRASLLMGDGAIAAKLGSLAGPLSTAGRILGPAGAVLGVLTVGTDIAKGDYARAGYDGVTTALGIAALCTPPPADLALGAAAGVMALGGLAYDNVPFVHDAVDSSVKFVGDAAGAVGDAASDLGHGVAKAAEDLWPF